jgi:Domain of unknown function (DUF397)
VGRQGAEAELKSNRAGCQPASSPHSKPRNKGTKMKSKSVNKVIVSEKTFPDAAFRKSSMSGKFDGNSNCVEVAIVAGAVGVRDSKNRTQSLLQFSRSEWTAFIKGVKAGEFDVE